MLLGPILKVAQPHVACGEAEARAACCWSVRPCPDASAVILDRAEHLLPFWSSAHLQEGLEASGGVGPTGNMQGSVSWGLGSGWQE